MVRQRKKFFAFTLVELMAVVAVLMVLVALALPRYRLFIATSRQAEAQANLGIIATLQQSYQLRYDTAYFNGDLMGFGDCGAGHEDNALGFRSVNCNKLRYKYSAQSSGGGSAHNDGTDSTRFIYPKCGSADTWAITEQREISNDPNVIADCDD